MALSESHVREMLRHLPTEIALILDEPRYWDTTFLRLYLDCCDSILFDDPKTGLEFALIAPDLAHLIPQKCPYEWHHTGAPEKQLLLELIVRSYAFLGGAYRTVARLDDADRAYRSACRYAASGPIGRAARADLNIRLAKLRVAQKRPDDALRLIDDAIEACQNGDKVHLAEAITTKGYVLGEDGQHAAAIPFFARALTMVRPKRKASSLASRTFHCAIHNLANALAQGLRVEDLVAAIPYLRQARRLLSDQANSVSRYKLLWVEARVLARLGSTRLAERRLIQAHKQLLRVGAAFEAALVALELSLLHLRDGEWAKLEELARATFLRFRELSSDTEAIAALRLWVEGAKKRSASRESLQSLRDKIEAVVARPQRGKIAERGFGTPP